MSVTPINQKRQEALSQQFDQLVADAATLCVVSVTKDGGVDFMLPDTMAHDVNLIGALEVAKNAVYERLAEINDL